MRVSNSQGQTGAGKLCQTAQLGLALKAVTSKIYKTMKGLDTVESLSAGAA